MIKISNEKIIQSIKEGMTVKQIAEEAGSSVQAIYSRIKHIDPQTVRNAEETAINSGKFSENRGRKSKVSDEEIIRAIQSGKSGPEIAKETGISYTSVYLRLKKISKQNNQNNQNNQNQQLTEKRPKISRFEVTRNNIINKIAKNTITKEDVEAYRKLVE